MGPVIGEILPLALGIAISPVPIIAAILMLLSPQAKGVSVGFLAGWVVGIIVTVVIFTLLSGLVPDENPDASKPIAGTIRILLGTGLLVLAATQWRRRPVPGEKAALPNWMAAIDTVTTGRATFLGFLLAAANPKNLLMAIGAGVAIGAGGLTRAEEALAIAVFLLIAASTVAIPVIAYVVASRRMTPPLESLRDWLVTNNATVMTVLLLVLGMVVIGNGIGSL
ncbi:GAP family protein [Arthrobacter sp. YAF17]|uniref:GAP family protein n=1 Tax=Arthrobacter sp. YAF17 TaxID=3233077 RepID=UPI003F8EC008